MKLFPAIVQVFVALLCFAENAVGQEINEDRLPIQSVAESYGTLISECPQKIGRPVMFFVDRMVFASRLL